MLNVSTIPTKKKLKDSKSRATSKSVTQQIHRAATLPSCDQNRHKYQPPYSLHLLGRHQKQIIRIRLWYMLQGRTKERTAIMGNLETGRLKL